MLHDTRRRSLEVARFLRSRRSALQPTPEEIRTRPRRRVSGLAREEVAARAGVSVTWYSWLEMGRDVRASPQTLASIARALQLNADETSYLLTLAADPRTEAPIASGDLEPALCAELVNGFTAYPAFVVDRKWSVLASNEQAQALYGFAPSQDLQQNILWRLLRDPVLRALHEAPDEMMRSVAAIVRYNFADDPDNRELADLIDALNDDERFGDAWSRYAVRSFSPFNTVVHWNAQALRFQFVALAAGYLRRETLVVHVPLDEQTRQSLALAHNHPVLATL